MEIFKIILFLITKKKRHISVFNVLNVIWAIMNINFLLKIAATLNLCLNTLIKCAYFLYIALLFIIDIMVFWHIFSVSMFIFMVHKWSGSNMSPRFSTIWISNCIMSMNSFVVRFKFKKKIGAISYCWVI